MDDVGVFKTPYDMGYCIGLPNICKKLIAQTLTLRRAGHQSSDVDKLHGGGDLSLRFYDGRDLVLARVGDSDNAGIGLDGTERKVFRVDTGAGKRIKQRRLANIRQSNDAAFNSHDVSFPEKPDR